MAAHENIFYICQMEWQEYIASDKDILLGKPVIKGTRISIELILELLSAGWSEEMIFQSYPSLQSIHLQAVFAYLRDCIQHELFFPLPKSA
jgi:uncharacterized protein (DUF433 family)